MPNAAVYVRISADREGAGLGVDRQEQDCRELADRLGYTVGSVHRDNDISASSGRRRPGYLALLGEIRDGAVSAVIAWHTDRLHRRPVELEEYIAACERHNVVTLTVKAGLIDLATPAGKMVARTLGNMARYEVDHMVERQARAAEQAAAAGRFRGGRRRFGYEADGVTVNPAEAAEVLRLTKAVLAGDSLNSLVRDMNRRGVVTSAGHPWTTGSLRVTLMRARNAGLSVYRGKEVGSAEWPAIVPEALWRGVVAMLTDPGRTTTSTARRWLGTGGVYLCHCGAPVRAVAMSAGRAFAATYYGCASGVRHMARKASEVDRIVADAVIERLERLDRSALESDSAADESAELHLRREAARARLNELAVMFASGDLGAEQLSTASALLRRQVADIDVRLGSMHRDMVFDGVVGVPDVRAAWERLDLTRQRALARRLVRVELLPSGRGRPKGWKQGESYVRPDTVHITWLA